MYVMPLGYVRALLPSCLTERWDPGPSCQHKQAEAKPTLPSLSGHASCLQQLKKCQNKCTEFKWIWEYKEAEEVNECTLLPSVQLSIPVVHSMLGPFSSTASQSQAHLWTWIMLAKNSAAIFASFLTKHLCFGILVFVSWAVLAKFIWPLLQVYFPKIV